MSGFWSFNIGHLVTAVGGIVSIAIVWQKLNDKVGDIASRLGSNEMDMKELTKMGVLNSIVQHERRITALENMRDDLSTLKADIAWIKRELERGARHNEN